MVMIHQLQTQTPDIISISSYLSRNVSPSARRLELFEGDQIRGFCTSVGLNFDVPRNLQFVQVVVLEIDPRRRSRRRRAAVAALFVCNRNGCNTAAGLKAYMCVRPRDVRRVHVLEHLGRKNDGS